MAVDHHQHRSPDRPDAPTGGGSESALAAKLRRVRATYEMCGARVTARLLLYRLFRHERLKPDRVQDVRAFDAAHGVETSAVVPPESLGIVGANAEHAVEYAPTAVKSFHYMMSRLGIDPSRYVFVDVGCGKGLVLLLASDLPFKRIIGVEASGDLCEIARQNIERYESPSQRCADLELHEGDATAFPMPEDDTVYYMCNPFGPVVLEEFLNRLEESLRACPRHVLLVYDNPWTAYAVLDGHSLLTQVENHETISSDYTWCFYENAKYRVPAE